MKSITSIIGNGNLTPRERFLLLVQDDLRRVREGKGALSEADKAALEGRQAKTNEEAQEWNRLNEGWKRSGRIELEAMLYFNDAQAAHLRAKPVLLDLLGLPFQREVAAGIARLRALKTVTFAEAAGIAGRQRAEKLREGLDFEQAAYGLAFERLAEGDRERLVELFPDVRTERDWLDDEEAVAAMLRGGKALDAAAKGKIAEIAAARAYNAYAGEYQLFHYYACFPLVEVARHFLETHGVSLPAGTEEGGEPPYAEVEAATEAYAKGHGMTVGEMVREGFAAWYDAEGSSAHEPLALGGEAGLLGRWIAAREGAREELEGLIRAGALGVRERTAREVRRGSGAAGDRMITGESLYALPGGFGFAGEFRESVDRYDPGLGVVYAEGDPERRGKNLDQELVVCQLDGRGKPGFFSAYGRSLDSLEAFSDALSFVKEESKDGRPTVAFRGVEIEGMFRGCRETLVSNYAKLLAVRDVLRKLSATYEADLAYRVDEQVQFLDGYIRMNNEALDTARKPLEPGPWAHECAVDERLYIDASAISPDAEVMREHVERLKEIFWDFK